jgi:hypothetical protein
MVPDLNLGWDTKYPDKGFSWFSSVSPGKFQTVPQARQQPLPYTLSNSCTILVLDAILSEILTTALNKP